MSVIETVDLCQTRDDRDILKNINLTVERSEVFLNIVHVMDNLICSVCPTDRF